jgi:O-antigen ligase/polysaccharide polymerase Wzy-like membrane protein
VDGTTRARTATITAIAAAYVGLSLLQGGYATTSVAWVALVAWILVGGGIMLRVWPGPDPPRTASLSAACFAGLALLSVVSMAWADDAGRAFTAALLPAAYAGLLLVVVLSFPAVRPRTWLIGLAAGSTIVAALALASRLDPGFLGTRDALAGAQSLGAAGRLSYPIGYWNGLAACAACGLVLLAWLGGRAHDRAGRAIAVGLMPIGGLVLFFTSSRGGVLAVVLGAAILIALGPSRARLAAGVVLGAVATAALSILAHHQYDLAHDLRNAAQRNQGLALAGATVAAGLLCGLVRWRLDDWLDRVTLGRRLGRALLIVAAGVVAVAVALANPAEQVRKFVHENPGQTAVPGTRSLLSSSGSGRAQFWEAAIDAFGSRPAGGVGAGNYELYWNAHPEAATVTGNAHSLFLEALADLGLPGLALAVGPFALALLAAWRAWRLNRALVAPALALLVAASVGASIDWTWKIPVAFGPAVIAIGLLTANDPGRRRSAASVTTAGRGRMAPPTARGFGLGVLTLLFAWAVVWLAGIVLYASYRLEASRSAVGRGDLAAAASAARDAAAVEPFSPEPQLELALVYELGGDTGRAREAARDAISKAPSDWRGWAVASVIDRRAGRTSAARLQATRARALTPVPLPQNLGVRLG